MELKNCNPSSLSPQKSGELLCQHKDDKEVPPPFAHGLCKSCFEDVSHYRYSSLVNSVVLFLPSCVLISLQFMEISGGLNGGSDPPAFQLAERVRAANASAKKSDDSEGDLEHRGKKINTDKRVSCLPS